MKQKKSFVSSTAKRLPASGIRKFFDLARGIDGLISLGVGEPDFDVPWAVREAAIYAIEQGKTHYTSNWGLPQLREEICSWMKRKHGAEYGEGEVLATTGASEAVDLSMRATLDQGDSAVVAEPCYVAYAPCVLLAGATPIPLPTFEKDEFKVIPENLEKLLQSAKKNGNKPKMLVLNYPNNPTGAVMPRKELEEVAGVAVEHDLFVVSDEIYSELTYEGAKHACFATLNGMKDRCVVVNGFSKAFSMTGFRLGFACGPTDVIEAMMKVHQYSMLCAPTVAQFAAIEALKAESEVDANVREYDRRRRLLVKGLNDAGLHCFTPKGAFYAFPSVKSTGLSSEEFCERLLKEKKVVTVPGSVFGESGKGFVRCTYATSTEKIADAVARIGEFTAKL